MSDSFKKRRDYLPEDVDPDKIRGNIVSGSFWSGLDAGFMALISFIRSIIFARLLAPTDFGIVAIATVFTQFVLIFANFGFTVSVIYQRNLQTEDVATCWWGNFIIDTTATIFCIGAALLSRRFTETPETPWIIIILSLQFFINSIGSINLALLQRMFRFKTITLIKIVCSFVGFLLTLILVTIFKLGVYGLAWGMVAQSLMSTVLYFAYLPWLPSFCGSIEAGKRHLKYGGWFLGVNVVTYANGNLDKVAIGTFLDNTQLGFFEYASRFPSMVVSELGIVLNRVLFSAFSTLQDKIPELRRLMRDLFRYNALLIYPMLFGLGVVAHDFVFVFYGEKWMSIVIPMQLLCLYGVVRIFTNPLYALANGIGKPSLPFKWTLGLLPVNALALLFLTKKFGIEGVAIGKGIIAFLMIMTLGLELIVIIKESAIKVLLQVFPALISSMVMVTAVVVLHFFFMTGVKPTVVTLVAQIVTGIFAYIGTVRFFWPNDFKKIIQVVLRK